MSLHLLPPSEKGIRVRNFEDHLLFVRRRQRFSAYIEIVPIASEDAVVVRQNYHRLHDFPQSKNIRRFDVSQIRDVSRKCLKVSPKCRVMSCVGRLDVVSLSLDVVFLSVLTASLESFAHDITRDASSRYDKRPVNRSAICDRKGVF